MRVIENLFDKAQSAALFNGSTGNWFRTILRVRQGCLLSLTPINIVIDGIICEALDEHEGSVSIGGQLITTFRITDDIKKSLQPKWHRHNGLETKHEIPQNRPSLRPAGS